MIEGQFYMNLNMIQTLTKGLLVKLGQCGFPPTGGEIPLGNLQTDQ
jgi:hypothetical protein